MPPGDGAVEARELRHALGHYATGVAVVTARGHDGTPVGLTCNSFTSVSLEPPLVQWSIARASRFHAPMCAAGHFAVHVLERSQDGLARQFSSRQHDRFAGVQLDEGLAGLPLLAQYHARFQCQSYARHDAGDHTILIGRVLRFEAHEGEPLVFYRGGYPALRSRE
jgi:flavin reductase (DIM6/NTAB) family NADH-FMN oxidoreductase RutF